MSELEQLPSLNLVFERRGDDGYCPPGLNPEHLDDRGILCSGNKPKGVCYPIWLPQFLRQHEIPFREVLVHQELKKDEENWLIIQPEWMDYCFKYEQFTKYLSELTLKMIRDGVIKLVIFYPNEGYQLTHNIYFMPELHRIMREEKIPREQVYLVFGDLNVRKNYGHFCEKEKIPEPERLTQLIGMRIFEAYSQQQYNYRYREESRLKEELVPAELDTAKRQRERHFLCLNGTPRENRVIFVSELERLNLLQFGRVSFLGHQFSPSDKAVHKLKKMGIRDAEGAVIKNHVARFIKNWKPLQLDIEKDVIYHDHLRLRRTDYEDTFFSVVTETFAGDGEGQPMFITEKTYKPILNLHMFMILGPTGTLKLLREDGYKTFPQIFDESYDDELHWELRLRKVRDEVARTCSLSLAEVQKMYESVWDDLVYNRRHYLERSHRLLFVKMIQQIAENAS